MSIRIVKGLQKEFIRTSEVNNRSKISDKAKLSQSSEACSVSLRYNSERLELRDYNEAKEQAENVADSVRLQENSLAAHDNIRNAVLI